MSPSFYDSHELLLSVDHCINNGVALPHEPIITAHRHELKATLCPSFASPPQLHHPLFLKKEDKKNRSKIHKTGTHPPLSFVQGWTRATTPATVCLSVGGARLRIIYARKMFADGRDNVRFIAPMREFPPGVFFHGGQSRQTRHQNMTTEA
ncbi:hypothetical protein ElyMa_005296300 [Elysia marginata]|uniref:Uncharacterized protein n=1 Tax=Elysia marginata TaxID=1093978 RepID=A0AAV4JY31_9GAST|nr:hypothetical protein ElyMa_005296300 [Elysia marginata]